MPVDLTITSTYWCRPALSSLMRQIQVVVMVQSSACMAVMVSLPGIWSDLEELNV